MASETGHEGTPQAPSRLRLLVVDDDPFVASGIRRMLRSTHDVETLTDAREALRLLLAKRSFDVVLCDLTMPEYAGTELYHALQEQAPEFCSRFIFMTGGVVAASVQSFLNSTSAPVLIKPFSIAQLQALLAEFHPAGSPSSA